MTFDLILFYTFSILSLVSALMVINLSNAVHSVLFLILTFCNVTFLLLLVGAEFFSFLLLIVYVGAIAVLFLFVIMMLNIKSNKKSIDFSQVTPVFSIILFLFIKYSFYLSSRFSLLNFCKNKLFWINWIEENYNENNVIVIGKVLYTKFGSLFIMSGLILLVAMIGAIVLTMHQNPSSKRQCIESQLIRNSKKVIKFINLRKVN